MAFKSDLVTMRQEITQDTENSISEAVGPIKTEVTELKEQLRLEKERVTVLEKRIAAGVRPFLLNQIPWIGERC